MCDIPDLQYVPLGVCCSPAAVLRTIELRKFALPFDWTIATPAQIATCVLDDFRRFHSNVNPITPNRVADEYGIVFPHDYPTYQPEITEDLGAPCYTEKQIVPNWRDFQKDVLEKYARRIARFRDIMRGTDPVVVLHRGHPSDVAILKGAIEKAYGRRDVPFVVATKAATEDAPGVYFCDPERTGRWNDEHIWTSAVEKAKKHIAETRAKNASP